MKKIRFRLSFNKKKVINGIVEEEVKIEARQGANSVDISTNVFIYSYQWKEDTLEIVNHPNGEALNRLLQEELIKLEWMELQYWKKGKPISLQDLYTVIQDSEPANTCFADFCKDYITKCNKKESTKNNLLSTVKILESYYNNINIEDVNYEFMVNLEHMLVSMNYKINTVAKHVKHIKSFYNEAITRNMLTTPDDNVRRYKTKHCSYKYSFLTPDELIRLEMLSLEKKAKRLQHSLDAFLFCCYTGLRYSDFKSLNADSIVKIDNAEWIIYKSVKTSVETKLPLHLLFHGKALLILNKYRNDINSFFNIKTNSSVDKDLIIIKELSGIKTHISFHTARHTNATLLIYNGINITTVQKLLGHKSIKTTQHYIDILPEGIINDLKKGFG